MAAESHDVARPGVRTVVMTRQPEQSGAVEAGLAAAGHRVAYLPLTDFELPEDTGPLRAAVAVELGRRAGVAAHPSCLEQPVQHGVFLLRVVGPARNQRQVPW